MAHIKQISESGYTIINTNNYLGDLNNHPAIIQYPELFEIVNSEIPENVEYLNFISRTPLEIEKEKQLQRRRDGIDAIAELMAEYKIAVNLGYVTEEQNRISTEELIPVSNLIMIGEWKFAKSKLIEIGSLIIGENLYNTILETLDNYINNNY